MILPDHVEVNEARPARPTDRRAPREGDKEQGQRTRPEGRHRREVQQGENKEGGNDRRSRRTRGESDGRPEGSGSRGEKHEGSREHGGNSSRTRKRQENAQQQQ